MITSAGIALAWAAARRFMPYLIVVTAAVGCGLGCYWAGASRVEAKYTAIIAKRDAADAAVSLRASEDARRIERETNERLAAVAAAYQAEKTRAQTEFDAVVRSLRNDSLRLRDKFKPIVCGVPGDAAAPAEGDSYAELRRDDVEFLFREAKRADDDAIALNQCEATLDALYQAHH
ncbi:hypothetical protein [Nevskia ramosa]|uniref:hypothetical protein n=1 Tax=Nevskia ramosa TaxID=64002 RepID=UPI003D1293C6